MHLLHKIQHLLTSFWLHMSPETSSKGGQLDTIASVLLPSAQAYKELKTPANRKSGRILGSAFLNSRASLWPWWCCRPRPAPKNTPLLQDIWALHLHSRKWLPQNLCSLFPWHFLQSLPFHLCSPNIGCDWSPHFWTSGPLHLDITWNVLRKL